MAEPRADFIVGLKATADTQGFTDTDAAAKKSKDNIVEAQREVVAVTEQATKVIEEQAAAAKAAASEMERAAQNSTAGPQPLSPQGQATIDALNARLAGAQQLTSAEREEADTAAFKNSLLAQRKNIVEAEYEKNLAILAGDEERITLLSTEIAIRRSALQIQQQTKVSEGQAAEMAAAEVAASGRELFLKEQQLATEKQIAAEKKKQAAEAREANQTHGPMGGFSTARNVGLSQGGAVAAGTTALLAGQAASLIEEQTQQMQQQLQVTHQLSEEFSKQVQEWGAMAQAASSQSDVLKLHESITHGIAAAQEKVNEVQERGRGRLRDWADDLKSVLNKAADEKSIDFHINTNADDEREELERRQQALVLNARNEERQAQEHARKMSDITRLGLDEQITAYSEQLERQSAIRTANEKANTEEARRNFEAAGRQIEELAKLQEEASRKKAKLAEDSKKADKDFNGGKRHDDREDVGNKIDDIKSKLSDMGVLANTPVEAMDSLGDSTDEATLAAKLLVNEWKSLIEKGEDLAKREGKALEDNMANEAKAFKEREAQHEKEGKAIEENMARVAEEGRRQVDQREKEGKALDENMAKLGEEAKKREEIKAEWSQQNEVLRAQISGNETVVKQLESQLQYTKDKARYQVGNITAAEAANMAAITKELRDQVTLAQKKKNLESLHDEDDIAAAENGRSKRRLRDAKVTAFRRKRMREYEQNEDPDKARKDANDAGEEYERSLKKKDHVIGGSAKRSAADEDGDDLDDREKRDKAFDDLFTPPHLGDAAAAARARARRHIPPIQPPVQPGDIPVLPDASTPPAGGGNNEAASQAASAMKTMQAAADVMLNEIKDSANNTKETLGKITGVMRAFQSSLNETKNDLSTLESVVDTLPP